MKLEKEEFKRMRSASPLETFMYATKSVATRNYYTLILRHTLCDVLEDILKGTFEQRVDELINIGRTDPDWIRDMLLNLSKKLRQRTELDPGNPDYYNPCSFGNYFKPLKKLFDMSEIIIPWKRIYITFPEMDNVSDTRGWHKYEIQKMLAFSKTPVEKAVILLAASSGIRAGGFDINWGDIRPIYHDGDKLVFEGIGSPVCATVTIYGRTSSSYPAFITPETYDVLCGVYRTAWIHDIHRAPLPDDPVFKLCGSTLQRLSSPSLIKKIHRVMVRSGLRNDLKTLRRYEVPAMNGFRRFWNKSCKETLSKDSALSSLIKKEYMMGHTGLVSLDRNYFKTHIMELAEEYLQVVPNLTINDVNI